MIKPIGLTVPACVCWKQQPKKMEAVLDLISGEVCGITLAGAIQYNICDEARDYYLASIIWAVLSIGIGTKKDDDGSCAMYLKEYEALYDRLRPLIIQRIDHADAIMDKRKMNNEHD